MQHITKTDPAVRFRQLRNLSMATSAIFALAASLTLAALVVVAHPGFLIGGIVTTFIGLACHLRLAQMGRRDFLDRQHLMNEAGEAKYQTDELFLMTDMLQSADSYEDASSVLMATSQRLLPGWGFALHIFNNSRDRLDFAGAWSMPESYVPSQALAPVNCWALKRGRRHVNDPATGTLVCAHHGSPAGAIEIPMMARGTVYGLLTIVSDAPDSYEQLLSVRRIGQALADSMSLALSNIALRDKLRTQSLRDPLTGLYNRRYMEDALERYVSLAERTGSATAVLMIDLDNFKALNDEHGHAKGDAVLRDVAAQLMGGLRPSDVVCRYGGEELMVILPDCPLDAAVHKAEMLRVRVEALSEPHQARISASFGVAAIPETATGAADLVPMADAALYRAKHEGKNRVVMAERRGDSRTDALRLAVTGRKPGTGAAAPR